MFPAAAELLGELLPEDEILIDHRHADGPVDVIIPLMSRIDGPMLDRFQPRLIQQFGVGLEGVDLDAARERGIAVDNVPAAGTGNADGVGEVAVMHLLVLARRLGEARDVVADRRLGEPIGMPLTEARVVILGLGAVGQAVIGRLDGFGARLIGVGSRARSEMSDAVAALALAEYHPAADLVAALDRRRCAHRLRHPQRVDPGDGRRGRAGSDAPGGYVVNVARGPVVDYDALLAALRSGQIGGAGLDVYWDEPVDPQDPLLAENVSVTPHIGGVTTFSYRRIAERVVAGIERHRA